ncbi:unnamed protein product [Adineta steineri]|uniref:G-protein coupled receptors family 1 profile domain-containing protein n=1 Tax=Adineta steineri TaxID=433720 RepID=A0A813UG84_9BILA|nr:unnamed protein product [Adineta steineri]
MAVANNSTPTIDSFNTIHELTWNEILYDNGLATHVARSSFRWLTICICLIGIIGNMLAVYTLLRRRMRTLSTYTYLTALCISNIITQIAVIIFEVEIFVPPNHLNCFVVSIAKAFASSTFGLSTWITVGFTVDRYVMICFPFIGKHKCTRRNAIYIIIICLCFSITYLIPQLLAQKCDPIIQYNSSGINNTDNSSSTTTQNKAILSIYWVTSLSEMGKSSAYRLTVTLFFNCLLIRIVPFLVIFQLNFLLIKTLARAKRRHRQINPFEENRNDVTYMLVIVISTYLLCIIPSIPFAALFAYNPTQYIDISLQYRMFQYMDDLTQFLMILNSALQCYLYIFFGKRFRRELSSFLCHVCIKYFYMKVPQSYFNHEREQFNHDVWNPNDAFELVLEGEWSTTKTQETLTGLEFSFHYTRRGSRLQSSAGLQTRSGSLDDDKRLSVGLIKPIKKSC